MALAVRCLNAGAWTGGGFAIAPTCGKPAMAAAQGARSIRGMPKYELREDAATVSIEVSGVGDERQERELLEAFDDCRSGRCSCPTDQYDKLASMDVDRDADSITLRLQPKPGAQFDTAELHTCLEHTIAKTEGSR